MTNILFLEQCIPATDCQKYQDKQDRLGQADFFYNGQTWLDVFYSFKFLKNKFLLRATSYTEQRSPDTLDYSSADYTELYDYLVERICETGEKEDKVCCSKDDIGVRKFSTFFLEMLT